MADSKKKASNSVNKQYEQIRDIQDIVYRGMWSGRVVPEQYINTIPIWKRIPAKMLTWLLNPPLIMKESRQQIPSFVSQRGPRERAPEYDYGILMELTKNHWLLRQIFRAIINEVINPRWEIKPRFKKKCNQCGREYNSPEIEKCEICEGTDFKTPDWEQYGRVRELIKDPSPDRDFIEFIRSSLWYDLALDDFYWEIGKDRETGKPAGFRVLDSSTIKPVMDSYGNLGEYEYFCPKCYPEAQTNGYDDYVDSRQTQIIGEPLEPVNLKCKKCGYTLIQTAYKQKANNKVVARWGKDEVIYNSSSRIDPNPFGLSKVVACVKHLYIIDFMDEYNFQVYSHGEVGSFLVFPGHDKTEVSQLKAELESEIRAKDRRDVQTGENISTREIYTAFIGAKEPPVRVPVMEDLSALQSLDYYKLYVEKVSGVFGVTPIFTSITTSKEGGTETRLEIDVQNRVTRGYQKDIEDPFNDKLLPKFGITDYIIQFGKVESRDMLREAQIQQTKAMTASLLSQAGYEVEIGEDFELAVSRKRVVSTQLPVPQSRLEEGKLPQSQDGAPSRTMPGGVGGGIPIQEPEVTENAG